MYGLSEPVDWSFLVGREVLQVCIGVFQAAIHFDQDVSLFLECEFAVKTADSLALDSASDFVHRAKELTGLLTHTIDRVESQRDGRLDLYFSNSATLTVFDSNEEAESYQVHRGSTRIIV